MIMSPDDHDRALLFTRLFPQRVKEMTVFATSDWDVTQQLDDIGSPSLSFLSLSLFRVRWPEKRISLREQFPALRTLQLACEWTDMKKILPTVPDGTTLILDVRLNVARTVRWGSFPATIKGIRLHRPLPLSLLNNLIPVSDRLDKSVSVVVDDWYDFVWLGETRWEQFYIEELRVTLKFTNLLKPGMRSYAALLGQRMATQCKHMRFLRLHIKESAVVEAFVQAFVDAFAKSTKRGKVTVDGIA